MNIKILNCTQITKDIAKTALSNSKDLSQEEINEYLDVLSALRNNKFVYSITTSKGEFILYVDAKPSILKNKD